MSVTIKGLCGAELKLPYSEDFSEEVEFKSILELFPDILKNDDAIKHLVGYKKISFNNETVFSIITKVSPTALKYCLDNENFNKYRSQLEPVNLCMDEFFNGAPMKDLTSMAKMFTDTFAPIGKN